MRYKISVKIKNGFLKNRKSSVKRKCHDENVFLKADTALIKLSFLFHLKSKTNWINLRKCNSHPQFYKIDLSFSIKLQEINLYVCEEHKTEREARDPNRMEREERRSNISGRKARRSNCEPQTRSSEAWDENVSAKQADF